MSRALTTDDLLELAERLDRQADVNPESDVWRALYGVAETLRDFVFADLAK